MSIEVYVARCFSRVPLILMQTLQMNSRRKTRSGMLDSNGMANGGLIF